MTELLSTRLLVFAVESIEVEGTQLGRPVWTLVCADSCLTVELARVAVLARVVLVRSLECAKLEDE